MMSELLEEYGIELIAEVLKKAVKPVGATEIRRQLKIDPIKFEALLNSLLRCNLLKSYINSPQITDPLVAITDKGKRFLNRYKALLDILGKVNNPMEIIA